VASDTTLSGEATPGAVAAGATPAAVAVATASPPPSATVAPTVSATGPAPATADPLGSVKFTDVKGLTAEPAIKAEAALGVFGTRTGAFHPDAQVTRGQYVAWLITANNIYLNSNGQIRLADSAADQTFVDVPKSNPFFPQIEGMADAGYVIGIDAKHFAPSRPLTREELVAIQVARYMNGAAPAQLASAAGMYCVHLADAAQVSKPYWGWFNTDQCTGFSGQDDLHRIFGSVRTLHPQRPVTRADVAIALYRIAGVTAAQVLPK
jgi:hypothetical protein